MKRLIVSALLAAVVLVAAPVLGNAQEAQPISHYGVSGAGVPDFVRNLLPEGFFSMSITDGLASGANYVATLDLGMTGPLADKALRPASDGLFLRLFNGSDRVADVVVSAGDTRARRVENFVIHLEAGLGVTVDVGALASATRIHVVSLLPFTADFSGRPGAASDRVALSVLPPATSVVSALEALVPEDPHFSCRSASRVVQVCNAGTSDCVTARAKRRLVPSPSPGVQYAKATIQYPIGVNFHCPLGSSPLDDVVCAASGYDTLRCDGTPFTHSWQGLDETILYCIPSVADCTSGCTGSWDVSC